LSVFFFSSSFFSLFLSVACGVVCRWCAALYPIIKKRAASVARQVIRLPFVFSCNTHHTAHHHQPHQPPTTRTPLHKHRTKRRKKC
jgi:hypothetical protein